MMSEKYNINRYQNVEAILIFHYCVIHHTLRNTQGLGTYGPGRQIPIE